MKHSGFTLLEMLVVLAVLGIMSGVGYVVLMGQYRAQQLQEAGALIAAELKRARAGALKSGADQVLTWTASSFSAGAGRSIELPASVRLVSVPVVGVSYRAPYGTLDTPDDQGGWIWALEGVSGQRLDVVAVGVLGKPVLRPVEP